MARDFENLSSVLHGLRMNIRRSFQHSREPARKEENAPVSTWSSEDVEVLVALQKGDLRPLVDMLRTETLPHIEVVRWLGKIAEKEPEAGFWLQPIPRAAHRPKMNDEKYFTRMFGVGRQIHELYSDGKKLADAKELVASERCISVKLADNLWGSYRRVVSQMIEEGDNPFPHLKLLPTSNRNRAQDS